MHRLFALGAGIVALCGMFFTGSTWAVQTPCSASTYEQLVSCLNLPDASNGTGVRIIVRSDIVLELNQTVRVDGRKLVTIEGDSAKPAPVISDTLARVGATQSAKQNGANASLIEITGASTDISIRHLAIRDFGKRPNELKVRCRVGWDQKSPGRWDTEFCYAPILVGSARGDSRKEFPQRIALSDLVIDSDKAILIEARQVSDLSISNSRFMHGSVYGVYFHPQFSHRRIRIQDNDFKGAGTNAINLSNVDDVLIQGNIFTDNHIDPQFMTCSTSASPGKSGACSGGQIILADNRNAPVRNVKILRNTITMTAEHLGKKSTTGIEVKSGSLDAIDNILIEGNIISNISRHAIQVHKGAHSNIVIRNNEACRNLVDFKAADAVQSAVISTNGERGVTLDSNRVGPDCKRNPVSASFAGTPEECVIPVGQTRCAITVRWKISNLPRTSRPKVLIDGEPFAFDGRGAEGVKTVPSIEAREYRLELFFDQPDVNPAAAMIVRGRRG